MTTYITFGQVHRHSINGKYFDKDCIAAIPSRTPNEGRRKAFELFGTKFAFEYFDSEIENVKLDYYPRGIIYINND